MSDNEKNIEQLINNKRESLEQSQLYTQKIIDSVKNGFNDLNINSIKIGNQTLGFKETSNSFSSSQKDETYFITLMNNEKPLFILNINTDTTGYSDKKSVDFKNRQLSELIDQDMVMSLAPTCTIYSPKNKKPWSEIFITDSYQIFITDKIELEQLWANLHKWAKTAWHDEVMKDKQYFHKAQNVFSITLIHKILPDISWKFAQYKQKEIKVKEAYQAGMVDSLAQQEFKKIINSLVAMENHPNFSAEVTKILNQVKPMLAESMSGKEKLKILQKEAEKANKNLCKAYCLENTGFDKWTPKIPI